jgi:hypothetical protein
MWTAYKANNNQQLTNSNSHAGPHTTIQVGLAVQHVGHKSKVRLHVLLFDLLLAAVLALLFHEGLMGHKILLLL